MATLQDYLNRQNQLASYKDVSWGAPSGFTKYDPWSTNPLVHDYTDGTNHIKVFTGNSKNAGDYNAEGRIINGNNQSNPLWSEMKVGYRKNANGGYDEAGYFLPNLFNSWSNGGADQAYFNEAPKAAALSKYGLATNVNGQQGWIFPDWGSYENMMKDSGLDPTQNLQTTYHHTKSPSNGLSSALMAVASILNPVAAAAASAYMGAKTGNMGQAIGGLVNAFAPGAGTAIGEGMGLAGNVASSVGNGLINAGTNLASGRGLGDSLKGGLVSGLGSYAGYGLKDLFNGQGMNSSLSSLLSGAGSNILKQGIGSSLFGEPSRGLTARTRAPQQQAVPAGLAQLLQRLAMQQAMQRKG